MEGLILLLVIGAVVWFAMKSRSTDSSSTQRNEVSGLVHEGGLQPDFTFKGNAFISLREASDKGGDYGMKFVLALFKQERIVRLSIRFKKEWRTHDIGFDAIEGVKRIVLDAGEYGTYPVHLIVITTDGEGFPLREIILYPGEYKLLDALNDALHPKKTPES